MPRTTKNSVTVTVRTLNTHGTEVACIDELSDVAYSVHNRSRMFRVDVHFVTKPNPEGSVAWEGDGRDPDDVTHLARETHFSDLGRTDEPVTQKFGARCGHVERGTKVVNLITTTTARTHRPDPVQAGELTGTIDFGDIVCRLDVEDGCDSAVVPCAGFGEVGTGKQNATKSGLVLPGQSRDVVEFVASVNQFFMSEHVVTGAYVRYAAEHVQHLKKEAARIAEACTTSSRERENFFVWGYPGEGKTFFVSELAKTLGIHYIEIDLNEPERVPNADALARLLSEAAADVGGVLCALDEVDKRPDACEWLYPSIFTFLDSNMMKPNNVDGNKVFVLLGSTQPDYDAFIRMVSDENRRGGRDLVRRVPNKIEIPRLNIGDLLAAALSTVWEARPDGNRIVSVNSLALAYLLVTNPTNGQMADAVRRALANVKGYETSLAIEHLRLGVRELEAFFQHHPAAKHSLLERLVQIHP